MIKKTITFTDYNGESVTKDFWFHLTKAELLKMDFKTPGGLSGLIQKIINEKNTAQIVSLFEEIVLQAYGVKSDDGKRFIKNDQVRDEFTQSEAYSELFMELIGDEKAAAEFINGVIPADLVKEAQLAANNQSALPEEITNG